MKYIIEVTKEDCEGNVCNPYSCPVARALKRVFSDKFFACGGFFFFFRVGFIKQPDICNEWMGKHIRDGKPLPFSFELELKDNFFDN